MEQFTAVQAAQKTRDFKSLVIGDKMTMSLVF
jgi:hypothetical protein